MKEEFLRAADEIMVAAQLAAALEVSGWPKPGNIHRTADFHDTRYEHFIASSIGFGPVMREAALRGVRVGIGELQPSEVGVGGLVKEAVAEGRRWHRGGNTHLGTILLFTPL